MKNTKRQSFELCAGCQRSVAGDLYPNEGGTCYETLPSGEIRRWHWNCYRVYCQSGGLNKPKDKIKQERG